MEPGVAGSPPAKVVVAEPALPVLIPFHLPPLV